MHETHWKTQPVVSTCGTFLHALSRWVNMHLQKLMSFVPTYIKDSQELIQNFKQLQQLPPNARVFTADVVSMYTNIDTAHVLQAIDHFLLKNATELPELFPTAAVMHALRIIMENNIFEFGIEHFKQLLGTAMRTPAACIYATLYYGVHENTLLTKYKDDIILLKRFIDDMFGIWTCTEERFE